MSVRSSDIVWKHSQQKGSALVLLLAIADFADDDGAAYPSVDTLARKTRLSRRNVQILCDKIVKTGELTINPNAGPHGCNVYTLTIRGAKNCVTKLPPPRNSVSQNGTRGGEIPCHWFAPKPLVTSSKENRQEEEEQKKKFVLLWNQSAANRMVSFTDKRLKAWRQRTQEDYFRENYAAALQKLKASSFLQGKSEGGWKPDPEWFLRPDSVTKIMEGKYDNRAEPKSNI